MNDTVQMFDEKIACARTKNCSSTNEEMDAETYNSDYLYRRYTESWIAALVAFILLITLFACKIQCNNSLRKNLTC